MEHKSPTPLVATPRVLLIAAIVVAIAIFGFDSITPVEVTAGALYCAVVLMAVRLCRPRGVVIVAVGCMALTVLSHFLSPGDHWESAALINRFLGFLAIGATTFLALKNQSAQKALQRAEIAHVTRAQEQQKLLLKEMNHRVGNLFALAGGVVTISARFAGTPKDLAEAVRERLAALARAHELTVPDLTEGGEKSDRTTTLSALNAPSRSPAPQQHLRILLVDAPASRAGSMT